MSIQTPPNRGRFRFHLSFVLATMILWSLLSGCAHHNDVAFAEAITGGDIKQGQQLIYSYNCGACHTIPGVAEAKGTVGPPLKGVADRVYIAGFLTNTPENLARWIREPQKLHAGTAMPDLGMTKEQAVHMAAYLCTLR